MGMFVGLLKDIVGEYREMQVNHTVAVEGVTY